MAASSAALHGGFPLSAAQGVLDTMSELGIIPCLTCRLALQSFRARQHCYDVVDPTKSAMNLGVSRAWSFREGSRP